MPYVGQSVASLFGEKPQQATKDCARAMSGRAGRRLHEITRMNTPIKTGRLRESWRISPPNKTRKTGYDSYECSVSTDVSYAPYVESGTGLYGPKHAKYVIVPKTPGGTLHWVGPEGDVFAKKVLHPGSPGNHMLAIALNVVDHEAQAGMLFAGELRVWASAVEASAR